MPYRIGFLTRWSQPRTLSAYGILRIRALSKKLKEMVMNETIKNFKIVGILTDRKTIFIPHSNVRWIM